jgi:hypothetical protein
VRSPDKPNGLRAQDALCNAGRYGVCAELFARNLIGRRRRYCSDACRDEGRRARNFAISGRCRAEPRNDAKSPCAAETLSANFRGRGSAINGFWRRIVEVEIIEARDWREEVSRLKLVGDVSRAMICAAPDHSLIGGDFSSIESRTLAWLVDERWKIDTYRQFDVSGDPALEPYCISATHVLKRPVTPKDAAGRQIGKTCDLAFGFGGGLGAWRKFDRSNNHSDADIERFKVEWRTAHKATVIFWRALETAMRRAIRTRQPIALRSLTCSFENGTLYLTLPSGRRLAYPEARLVPGEFDGTTQIVFKDNARGGWTESRGWHGTFTENVVQAIARDVLAAALIRLEAAGYPVILHCHDECVCEVPAAADDHARFLKILTELPDWADGLPIAAKVWSGQRYAKTEAAPAHKSHAPNGAPEKQQETNTPPPKVNGVKSRVAAPASIVVPVVDVEEETRTYTFR